MSLVDACSIMNVGDVLPLSLRSWANEFYGSRAANLLGTYALVGPNVSDGYIQFVQNESRVICVRHIASVPTGVPVYPYVPCRAVLDRYERQAWYSEDEGDFLERLRRKSYFTGLVRQGVLPLRLIPGTMVVDADTAFMQISVYLAHYPSIFVRPGENSDGGYGNKRFSRADTVGRIRGYLQEHPGNFVIAPYMDGLQTIGNGFSHNTVFGPNGNVILGGASVGTYWPSTFIWQEPALVRMLMKMTAAVQTYVLREVSKLEYSSVDYGVAGKRVFALELNARHTNASGLAQKLYRLLYSWEMVTEEFDEWLKAMSRGLNGWACLTSDKIVTVHELVSEVVDALIKAGLRPLSRDNLTGFSLMHDIAVDAERRDVGLMFAAFKSSSRVALIECARMYRLAVETLGGKYFGELDKIS